jgi:hypothetical protein
MGRRVSAACRDAKRDRLQAMHTAATPPRREIPWNQIASLISYTCRIYRLQA